MGNPGRIHKRNKHLKEIIQCPLNMQKAMFAALTKTS
jgi:hypothetical protein